MPMGSALRLNKDCREQNPNEQAKGTISDGIPFNEMKWRNDS